MVGIVLKLRDSRIFLCPICTRVRIWKGTGLDFTTCDCEVNARNTIPKACCSVCSSRYVVSGPLLLPDVKRSRISRVYLCGKHIVPKHVINCVNSYDELQTNIRQTRKKNK